MKETTRDYRRMDVGKHAHQMVLDVYRVTQSFPADQRFSLVSQMQRAAASVPANIAEGCGRGGPRELSRFLKIARGSANELEYFIHLAHDLGYLDKQTATNLYQTARSTGKMITGYLNSLESQRPAASS